MIPERLSGEYDVIIDLMNLFTVLYDFKGIMEKMEQFLYFLYETKRIVIPIPTCILNFHIKEEPKSHVVFWRNCRHLRCISLVKKWKKNCEICYLFLLYFIDTELLYI